MNKEKLVIFGSGGLAKEIIGYLVKTYGDNHGIMAVVSIEPFNNPVFSERFKVLQKLEKGDFPGAKFILAVAEPKIKRIIVEKNEDRWTNYIHPSVELSPFAKIGKGCVFAPQSMIVGDCILGDFIFCNTNATVGHDSTVGDFTTMYPNTEVCGNCNIGTDCVFGIGSYVIPNINLPSYTKVSAGAVVRNSYEEPHLLVGNPAKPYKRT
jgi:sugar O-acyltransferase (sialic acid O-acetyltransferase NeuD family)